MDAARGHNGTLRIVCLYHHFAAQDVDLWQSKTIWQYQGKEEDDGFFSTDGCTNFLSRAKLKLVARVPWSIFLLFLRWRRDRVEKVINRIHSRDDEEETVQNRGPIKHCDELIQVKNGLLCGPKMN